MLHKIKPELTLYLAEEALKQKFIDTNINVQELIALQKDCRDYLVLENTRKIYARVMKAEVTKMMVEAVFQSLSPEEQKFVEMKYKAKKQMVAISLELNISVAQLNNWNREILKKISSFMLYKLSAEDIFTRKKVVSMVKILSKILEFVRKYDTERKFINTDWAESIADKLDRYFELLKKVDAELKTDKDSLHHKIILLKMKNPREKIEILAARCNVDKSIVCRHLKKFISGMKQYLD